MTANGEALRWTGRVLAFDDVRRRVNGHGELILSASTIVTPLAADQLREQGVRITRESLAASPASATADTWGIAQERAYPLIDSARFVRWSGKASRCGNGCRPATAANAAGRRRLQRVRQTR